MNVQQNQSTMIISEKGQVVIPVGTKYAGSLKGIVSTKEYLAMKEEDKLLEDRHETKARL